MRQPVNLNFDYTPEAVDLAASVVHFPKIYQGAPYDQTFAFKNATTGEYEDFSGYDDIRMDIRLDQRSPVLMSFAKSTGNFDTSNFKLRLLFPALATKSVKINVVNPKVLNEARFLHDIYLIHNGETVGKLAQGSGSIVGAITRLP